MTLVLTILAWALALAFVVLVSVVAGTALQALHRPQAPDPPPDDDHPMDWPEELRRLEDGR